MAREPYVTANVVDVNSTTIALTGNSSRLIRYMSHAKATMSATAYDGASINQDTRILKNGGDTGYSSPYTFYNVESEKFSFSVEDSNGLVGRYNYTADMIPYVKLTCHVESEVETDGTIIIKVSGECYAGTFGGKYNTLEVDVRYAKSGQSYGSWTTLTATRSGNAYTARMQVLGAGDYKESYNVQARASDLLDTVTVSETGVKSKPIFHWSGEDFVFEVPVTFNAGFTGGSSDSGDSSGSSSGTQGAESGVWTPSITSYVASSYTTAMGWYTKVGDVVTVGFFIKVQCLGDYESKNVVINGLPYSPAYSASGGGICSGAYVYSGKTFQCFVAEAGTYEITIRVQDCDRSNDENIGTSASGCKYPYDGGLMTLSGTITYVTND